MRNLFIAILCLFCNAISSQVFIPAAEADENGTITVFADCKGSSVKVFHFNQIGEGTTKADTITLSAKCGQSVSIEVQGDTDWLLNRIEMSKTDSLFNSEEPIELPHMFTTGYGENLFIIRAKTRK